MPVFGILKRGGRVYTKMIPDARARTIMPIVKAVEIDECYFGGVRKGKRGRGAAGKVPVFGILKRGGRVYT